MVFFTFGIAAAAGGLSLLIFQAYFFVSFFLVLILTSFVGFLPNLFDFMGRNKTSYRVTENYFIFTLNKFGLGKSRVYYIPHTDIWKITYEEYGDKSGTIHILTRSKPRFRTYNYKEHTFRPHPTFEHIPRVIEAFKKIEAAWKKRQNHQPPPPAMEIVQKDLKQTNKRRVMQLIQGAVLLTFLLYTIDYFFLPTKQKTETIVKTNRLKSPGILDFDDQKDLGGNYKTESGIRFSTRQYWYPEFINKPATIKHSPIFRSVKKVVINNRDYSLELMSDLHFPLGMFHLLSLLIIAGSLGFLFAWKDPPDQVLFQVAILNGFFLVFSLVLWIVFG
ncbi:MAG: hypothetical protein GYB31_02785 [Bacteroidetes bacterium]|nr:hypothetical protein [Bacteroidota bacterium]